MAKSYLCRWWRRLWEMCSRSCNSMSRWRQTGKSQHRHWCHSFAQCVNHMWFDRPWSSSWENWLQILIRRGWGDSWLSGGCYCHDCHEYDNQEKLCWVWPTGGEGEESCGNSRAEQQVIQRGAKYKSAQKSKNVRQRGSFKMRLLKVFVQAGR